MIVRSLLLTIVFVILTAVSLFNTSFADSVRWFDFSDSATEKFRVATTTIPIYSQDVQFRNSRNWYMLKNYALGNHYIIEMVRHHESGENWTQKFTVEGFRKLALKEPPFERILTELTGANEVECADAPILDVFDVKTLSSYPMQDAIFTCGNITKHGVSQGYGKVAYYMAVIGKEDVYLFYKTQLLEPFDTDTTPIHKGNVEGFIGEFMPIRLLDH